MQVPLLVAIAILSQSKPGRMILTQNISMLYPACCGVLQHFIEILGMRRDAAWSRGVTGTGVKIEHEFHQRV